MKRLLLFVGICFGFTGFSQQLTFNYTGQLDSVQIPNCVDSILIECWGAQGADAPAGGTGGNGGEAIGKLDVTPGQWIYITVGGQDGFNGGGIGGKNGDIDFNGNTHPDSGGNGGGASDVRVGGATLNDRVIVAGGGGGGGHEGVWPGCQPATPAGDGGFGGNGGDGTGGTSTACNCSGGGGNGGVGAIGATFGAGSGYNTGACGGSYNGAGADGALGIGGDGNQNYYNGTGGGGGGGGGYYGGGAGGSGWDTTPGGGGGGGSNYLGAVADSSQASDVNTGDGSVLITYIPSQPVLDLTVTVSGITLSAVQSGVSYQWVDCNNGYSEISGATNQDYTATTNSDYAVILDNGAGCVDTSACNTIAGVGLTEFEKEGIEVYPNPVADELQVIFTQISESEIQVFDPSGRLVVNESVKTLTHKIDMSKLESGMYFIHLVMEDKTLVQEIVKR